MKTDLDYCVKLPHHSDTEATMDISISNYSDGPQIFVKVDRTGITLNRADLHQLVNVLNRYDEALRIMEGVKS